MPGRRDACLRFAFQGYNPHAVLVMDFGSYRTSHIGAHLYPSALWVLEAGDDPQSFAVNAWLARQFDVVLSPDKPSVRLYEETAVVAAARSASGAKTSAGEAEIGYSAAVLGTPPGEADFRGPIAAHWLTHHAGIYEHDLDAWLANPGPRDFYVVTTCGNRGTVPEIGRRLGDDVFVSRRVPPGMPHHRLLASARIVINQAKWGEITRRIFEAMAAGALVVTDRLRSERGLGEVSSTSAPCRSCRGANSHVCVCPRCWQLFVEGEDIIVYDSVDEAVAKVRYYLEHEAERAAIASRAQVKVLQHHTARARAAQVHALLHYHLRSGTMGSRRRPNMPRVCRPVVASDSGSKAIVCVGGPTDGVTNSVFAAAAAGCAELDSLHLPCVKAVAASLSKMVCDGKLAYVNGLSGDPAVWCPPLAGFHKADQPPVWLDHDG